MSYFGRIQTRVVDGVSDGFNQARGSVEHCFDFGNRIVSKVEGLDTASKFGTSILTIFTKYVAVFSKNCFGVEFDLDPCDNLNRMFGNVIEFNKFSNFFSRSYSWINKDDSRRKTWKQVFQLAFLSAVTLFDMYNFSCIVRGVQKGGNVFKLLKNASFVSACTFGVMNDSESIAGLELRKTVSEKQKEKWKALAERNINGSGELIAYYRERIGAIPAGEGADAGRWQEKKRKWGDRIEQIEASAESGETDHVALFKEKVTRKSTIWEKRATYYSNLTDSVKQSRTGQKYKLLSLAIDVAQIALKVFSITSVTVAGYALPVLIIANVCFDLTNFYLGYLGMAKMHHKEYTVDAYAKSADKEKIELKIKPHLL